MRSERNFILLFAINPSIYILVSFSISVKFVGIETYLLMKVNKLWAYAVIPFFLLACGSKKNQENNSQDSNDANIKAYKENPDATTCDPSWSTNNIVINHWLNEPATLHPTNEYTSNRNFVFGYIHSYLMVVDLKTLELQPDLVKSKPGISDDGLIYSFELKDGITWDDGSPITNEDVLFTYKINAAIPTNNAFAKPYVENLEDVVLEPGSKTKFKLVLSRKYILNEYISTYFPIIQRSKFDSKNILGAFSYKAMLDSATYTNNKNLDGFFAELNGAVFGTEISMISGAGPYKLESWERGQSIILAKKTNHWSSKQDHAQANASYPDKIIFKLIADENALKIEANNQSVDVSTFISTKALQELEKNPEFTKNYHFGYLPAYNSTYLMMNNKPDGIHHKKFFNDIKVRKAMAYMTPVEEVIKIVYMGKAERLVGPVHPQKKGFNKNLSAVPFDLDKANTMLDEAGWKDSDKDGIRDKVIDGKKQNFQFKLMYPSDSPVAKDIADIVIEQYNKCGLKVVPDGKPMSELVPQAVTHDFDMTFFAFGQSALADDFEQLWGTKSWTNNGSNLSGFGNSQTDALIDSLKTELDWGKRIPMMERFQKIMYDDQPVIFFMASNRKIFIHKRFGNATMYYERPGVLLNQLKLICTPTNGTANVQ